eukprot:RCo036789
MASSPSASFTKHRPRGLTLTSAVSEESLLELVSVSTTPGHPGDSPEYSREFPRGCVMYSAVTPRPTPPRSVGRSASQGLPLLNAVSLSLAAQAAKGMDASPQQRQDAVGVGEFPAPLGKKDSEAPQHEEQQQQQRGVESSFRPARAIPSMALSPMWVAAFVAVVGLRIILRVAETAKAVGSAVPRQ